MHEKPENLANGTWVVQKEKRTLHYKYISSCAKIKSNLLGEFDNQPCAMSNDT